MLGVIFEWKAIQVEDIQVQSEETAPAKLPGVPRRKESPFGSDRLRVGRLNGWALGGVPRVQKMLKGHLPRVIYHQGY